MTKREITKLEKQIVNDIMSRSNYGVEKTTEIVRPMIDFGYTIHEQDYYKLKKVIEILKNILEIQIGVRVDERKILIVSIIEVGEWFAIDINEEQYELLKEVLGND